MFMKKLLTVILLGIATISLGQPFNDITLADFPGIQVTKSDSFTGQGLWGYMNGGADLYLEYGFQKLYVREYAWQGEKLKLEIFIMSDPASAFGIYALSTSKCLIWNSLADFSCQSVYQSQAATGQLYISATNESGSQVAQGLCSMLVQQTVKQNPSDQVFVPMIFQGSVLNQYIGTLRYYRGLLGLQNGMPEWTDLFSQVNFTMFTETVTQQDSAGSIGRIVFDDITSRGIFLNNAELDPSSPTIPVQAFNGLYHSFYNIDDFTVIFVECQDTLRLHKLMHVQDSIEAWYLR